MGPLEALIGGDPIDVADGDARHRRLRGTHLLELEGIVVDEGERVDPDVEVLRDPLQGVGLRHPVDLRVQEVFIEAERLELLPRVIEGVLARNAVEDAHLVELPDQGDHVLLRAHVVRLEEDPVPERLIEVPDDALDVGLRVLPLSLDPRAGASPVREPHEVGGQEHELRRLVPIGNQRHVEREPGLGDGRQVTVGELMARIAWGERDPRPKGRQGRGACGDLDLGSRDAQHNSAREEQPGDRSERHHNRGRCRRRASKREAPVLDVGGADAARLRHRRAALSALCRAHALDRHHRRSRRHCADPCPSRAVGVQGRAGARAPFRCAASRAARPAPRDHLKSGAWATENLCAPNASRFVGPLPSSSPGPGLTRPWRSGKIGAMALPSSALWDGPAPD